jgi:hypothetical protein
MEFPKRRSGRPRRVRTAVVGALAATAVMAFGAGSARAAAVPFSATFDDAALNVGVTFDILDPPNTAQFNPAGATIDNVSGAFTVPQADFVFPPFSGDALPGVPVTVTFTAVDPITGTLNLSTGALTTATSTYHARVQGFGGECNYDLELGFDTNPKSPFNGVPFTVTPGSPTSISHGAYSTSWAAGHNPPDNSAGCSSAINSLVTGAGGLAIGNAIDLTPTPPATATTPPATTAPKKKKCKKGFKLKKVHGKKKCVKKKKKK